jgi:NAD(P)-dependent dehydrogenase (short-subunit alcohol dehydrogenase family)
LSARDPELTGCVFVTGASSGIGRAAALHLARRGVNLIVGARRRGPLTDVAEECEEQGVKAEPLAFDLCDPEQIDQAAAHLTQLEERLGPCEGLVNNAGAVVVHAAHESVGEGGDDLYRSQLEVNFHGPRRLTERLLPGMLQRGRGAIVNVSSAAGLRPFPGIGAYSTAKHALIGWTRALAFELSEAGIRAAALCPYYVEGEMLDRAVEGHAIAMGVTTAVAEAEFAGRNPGGALVTLEQTSQAIESLLRPGANGRITVLDGGPLRDWEADRDCLDGG